MMLAELNYEIGPIIASAGIAGVALGFGAQNLVKDFLAGIFMIFEDQLGVGDVVDTGRGHGTVEAIGLRVARLRDVNGTVWYVRNGEILRVGNQSQNWARDGARRDVPLPRGRREGPPAVLHDVANELSHDKDFDGRHHRAPEIWGVEAVVGRPDHRADDAETAPMERSQVAREIRPGSRRNSTRRRLRDGHADHRRQPEPGRPGRPPRGPPPEADLPFGRMAR